jgi:hypothetical protein
MRPTDAPPGPLAERLDRRVVTQWRGSAALTAAVVVVVAGMVGLFVAGPGAGLAGAGVALVVGAVLAWVIPAQRWRLWSFAVTDDAVELHHGLLQQVHSVVPHFRVQHIAIERGVVERWLGLARLTVTTASAGSDTHIPGLTPERADAIRRLILDRTAAGDAV